MRKEIVLKVIIGLIVGSMLFAYPIKTFAADEIDVDSFFGDEESSSEDEDEIDLGSKDDLDIEDEYTDDEGVENETETENEKIEEQEKQEELPKAGLAEDTIMISAVIVLGMIAVFAYKKVNEYSNI